MHRKPPVVAKGNVIAIISPAGCISEKPVFYAKNALETLGYNVLLGANVFKSNGVFAGTDSERIDDFQQMVNNPDVSVILCSRGGYGCARIVDSIDFSPLLKYPKWIVGFSDVTVLHAAMGVFGIESCHAPMPTNFETLSDSAWRYFRRFLEGEPLKYVIPPNSSNIEGEVRTKIVGGNLSILVSMLGTPYQVDTKDKILFLEDVGEKYYQIDRMLQSLRLSGSFDKIKGLLVGQFTDASENSFGKRLEEIFLYYVKNLKIPVCFDFPAGHVSNNHPLILNARSYLSVSEKHVEVLIK